MLEPFRKAAFGLLALALLTSCGSSMEPRNGVLTELSSTGQGKGLGAECNSFSAQGVSLSGGVTTYYVNKNLVENQSRVRITGIDTGFSNSTQNIQFFRWKATADGRTSIDNSPLTFFVQRLADGVTISSTMTSLSMSQVSAIRTQGSLQGTSPQDFFSAVTLILTNVDYAWNAAKIVLYDGTTTVAQADVLLPVFPANPNTYGTNHPIVLSQLHPFWAIRNQNLTDAGWVAQSHSYCF